MFEELIQVLGTQPQRQPSKVGVGRALDLLRQIDYFQTLNSNFGADYLVLFLQTVQPFILREGFGLISENDHYMLIHGDLREQEPQFYASREVEIGRILVLNEKPGVSFLAKSDCKMLRIKRGPSAGFHLQKKLANLEKERKRSLQQMEKQFGGGEDYKNKFEFLQQMSFFKSLGEYDFLDLTTKSQIKEYRQGSTTHKCGGTVDMIGCVIIGKVKLHYPTDKEGAKGKKITVSISEGDWLGLQEYLWKQDYRSSGEVSSIIAMVVWIPIDIFESKFNTMANYSLINRLNDLIEVKKNLFERSLHCRRSKETEGQGEIGSCNAKLLEKIATLQYTNEKRRNNFRRTKNSKDILIPEIILHRMNFSSDLPDTASLPKLKEKINLFPEEYKATKISNAHLKELQRLQKIRNSSIQPKSYSFVEKDPEQLFHSILQRLPRKSKESPTQYQRTVRQQKIGIHYNMSIYNNFRVGKQRALSTTLRKFKTLDLLPKK